MTYDVIIRGGTVVTAGGSTPADVAVAGGRIAAIEPRGEGNGAAASPLTPGVDGGVDIVDASGLLILPGCVDVHTHTRIATDAEPDRFFQDSVAAAFGGTTTFLAFNNPGTGSSAAAEASLLAGLREWRATTEHDSAVDYAVSLAISGRMDDPIAELPAMVDEGVATAKAFMVFDFRLDDRRIFEAMRVLRSRGAMLEVHCEDPVLIDAAVADALGRGDTAPRFHATTRTPAAEAVATHRAMEFARASDAPVYVVHLSSAAALRQVREAKASGVRAFAETCPHYLALTDDRYDGPDDAAVARYVISPPLRPAADRAALWGGLATGDLDLIATDHVPDRVSVEKAEAAYGASFDRISNGAPGIETLLAIGFSEGVAKGRLTIERLVDLLATTPARLFGLTTKGAIEVGRDADLVLFDPTARRTLTAADLHHTSDYTPYEGFGIQGAVRDVFVRGRPIIRAQRFIGDRGFGQFVPRVTAGGG
jgi:dihydropyrimidinase